MSIRSPRRRLLAAVLLVSVAVAPGRAAEPDDDLEALQKRLLDRMLNGNPTAGELRGLIDEMNKKMLKRFPDLPPLEQPAPPVVRRIAQPGNGGLGLVPFPQPFDRQLPLAVPQLFPQPVAVPDEATDKQLKEFDAAIDKLKDDPEAQAELKKARDEYKKALEEGLKKNGGNVERPREQRPREQPGFQAVPRPLPPPPAGDRVRPIDIDVPVFPERAGRLLRPAGPVRLGVVFERPPAVLVEQLDLPAEVGVVVVEVQAGSPAEKVGLRKNDVVVKLGGQDAPSDLPRFQELVAGLKSGEKLDVVLYRKGKKETVKGLELASPRAAVVD